MQSNSLDFSYFIKLALQTEISWTELEAILEDLTPTLDKSKELNKVFLNELKSIHSQKESLNSETKKDELTNETVDEEYEEFDSETTEIEPDIEIEGKAESTEFEITG